MNSLKNSLVSKILKVDRNLSTQRSLSNRSYVPYVKEPIDQNSLKAPFDKKIPFSIMVL